MSSSPLATHGAPPPSSAPNAPRPPPPAPSSTTATASRQPLLTADHPYHIGAGDNPGSLLVSVPLTSSTDDHSWARSMCMSLLSKNKLGFVDGTVDPPERANVLVLSWLHRSVCPENEIFD
ncbi:hypothetical protein LINGRAHAP2_LOCUS17547 [Linum grandiflorum]